jgi:hypothetical protein
MTLRSRLRALGLVIGTLLASLYVPAAIAEPATAVIKNGPSTNRVDVAIVGDGYTAGELSKFVTDAGRLTSGMFAQEPLKEYAKYFNVTRVDVASAQSGADHPERIPPRYVTTAFDATYNCGNIQRLICVADAKVFTVLARTLTPTQYDIVIVVVNDPEYGGVGGAIAVASTHEAVVELVLHELGHSLGLLADEYGGGQAADCGTWEPAQPNVTAVTQRDKIKWNRWINTLTPIPTLPTGVTTPGLYEEAGYCNKRLYRPTADSKMRSLGRPYEQVNTEQLIKRVYSYVSPIDSTSPSGQTIPYVAGGSVTLRTVPLAPLSRALAVSWRLDGNLVATSKDFVLPFAGLAPGTHTVSVTVADKTPQVRTDPDRLLQESRSWTITVPQSVTKTFTPVEDTWVSKSQPTTMYGAAGSLKAKGGLYPGRTYVRFNVTGLSGTIASAKLRMRVIEPSTVGGTALRVGDIAWQEETITFNSAPTVVPTVISSVGATTLGQTVEFDVQPVVVANGGYSFVVVSASADEVAYSSKEGVFAPQLVITTRL